MAPPLKPQITGVPLESLGQSREPTPSIKTGSLSITNPVFTGSKSFDYNDQQFKNYLINSVTIKGTQTEAGGPWYWTTTITLKKNGTIIGTIVRCYGANPESETAGPPEILETFNFYQPLYLEKGDNLTIDCEISGDLEFDNINLSTITLDGTAFY